MTDHDVIVVGAGLAGMHAAKELVSAGRDVIVVEASDGVGGRVRTDTIDGFRVDRGFQVLLTGYPTARTVWDYDALDLRAFSPGVSVRAEGAMHTLADPLRAPFTAMGGAFAPVGSMADKLRLLALRQRLIAGDATRIVEGPNDSTREALAEHGFSEEMVERFFRPFFAGIFFDPDLTTSRRMFELIMRSFFRGDVSVPNHGMEMLSLALADDVGRERIHLETPALHVETGRVDIAGGSLTADEIIVAVEGPAAERLLGGRDLGVSPGRGTTTLWYVADTSPSPGGMLALDGDDGGPVNNVAVMSDVAPGYSPDGRALIAVSVIGVPAVDDAQIDRGVRAHLTSWYGRQVGGWSTLAIQRIPYAQPRQDPADVVTLSRSVAVAPGLWVCGDHRDTASIQGALVSGRRAARSILLRSRATPAR